MNKRVFRLFSSRHIILGYILIVACVFYLFIVFTKNQKTQKNQVKFYKTVYPGIQSLPRGKVIHFGLSTDEKTSAVSSVKQTTDLLTTSETTESPEIEYRILTNGCKIKSLPLFDNETIKLFENKTESIWKCNPDLIQIRRFDETWISLNWTKLGYKPFCYFRELSRGTDDFHYLYGEFKGPIENSTINFLDYEFVHILCYKNTATDVQNRVTAKFDPKDKDLIHNQIIPLIPLIKKTTNSTAPNILLLAIDSTSYINFQRQFIRTLKFVKQNNFFELRGYTKLGPNTFPNMIPFFVGHHPEEMANYNELMKITFDDWPIIWKNYSDRGFVTAFVEELGISGLFQFKRQGFRKKPTDYETRPFDMEIRGQKYNQYCYRDRTETEHSLEFTFDLIKAMNKRQQKYFAYISISEMTHDWLNGGHYMDVPYHQLFTKLFSGNLVKDTLILFFSDHGLRMEPIRYTRSGDVENRLPFIFIHLPKNFNQDYVENLRQNQFRLTTHFDVHATLVNLIKGKPDHKLPHGLSLIDDVISEDRDCNKASIPEQFCSCFEDIPVQDFNVIKLDDTIPKIMTKLNMYTSSYRSICVEFSFASIKTLYFSKLTKTITEKEQRDDSQLYLVQFYVNPGMALFETLIKGFDQNTRFESIKGVVRINRYGNQADCLDHKINKNFCYCRNLLNTN